MTLTVQIFGIVSLMGKQFVDFQTKLLVIDCYLPILPAMQVTHHLFLNSIHNYFLYLECQCQVVIEAVILG